MASSPYIIRPFRHSTTDMHSITNISATGNEHDELTKYMRRNIRSQWTSYRSSCGRWLKGKLAAPGTICYVAESKVTGEVVGWAIWSRHGESATAEGWKRGNSGWGTALERRLMGWRNTYYKWVPGVDRTAEHAHVADLLPVLVEEWPGDIFNEFWELDGLYVDPREWRRGIGRLLVSWGVEKGKEESVPVLVRSSPLGRRLYENVGFRVVKREEGFDKYIPEFIEDLKVKDTDEAKGCWALCWQPEGTDFLERARRKAEEEKDTSEGVVDATKTASPADAISVT
jgi:GNAT superfamily N-acetyltransferase